MQSTCGPNGAGMGPPASIAGLAGFLCNHRIRRLIPPANPDAMKSVIAIPLLILLLSSTPGASQATNGLSDKTLVVWVSPANLSQRGGSALTIDAQNGMFDAIVFGEKAEGRWMAGSNSFQRTEDDQSHYPAERAGPSEFVQIAIRYQANTVTVLRNGDVYAQYEIEAASTFRPEQAVVLFGRRHLDAGDADHSFAGRIRDARIYDRALDIEVIKHLAPSINPNAPHPWAWWDFTKHGVQEVTRRFSSFEFVGGAAVEDGHLVLPGSGATLIAKQAAGELWDPSMPVSKDMVRHARSLREKLLSDPYRPAYHFAVPEDHGYPGDPNGAFYHNGRYHLMYLYRREGSGFSWGHVSSTDLLHWRHHPDAIGPGDGDEGCFSGGAFVDRDGTAILSYWMLWGDKGIGLARSTDADFNTWEKVKTNPVIRSTEWGVTEMTDQDGKKIFVGSADPSNIWERDGTYYMATGNLLVLNKVGREPDSPESEKGDRLYLFRSDDLEAWDYVGRFYESDRKWTEASEDNMCPSFLPLPSSPDGGPPSDKHLLLFISHNLGTQYYIGSYEGDRFIPESHGRMTWTDNAYFAPEALIDGNGRQIMWAWIFEDRPEELQSEYGWTGSYGLPRSLWLANDGTLRMRPVRELEQLRMGERQVVELEVPPSRDVVLDTLGQELMELEITVSTEEAVRFGVKVGVSADGREETVITFDRENNELSMDTRRSGLLFGRKVVERAPLKLEPGEHVRLRIFVDRSIIEVFANDRQAIARRVYPTLGGKGIRLFSEGGSARVPSVRVWKMSPSNPF